MYIVTLSFSLSVDVLTMLGKFDIAVELANDYSDIFIQGNSGTRRLCMHFAAVCYRYKFHLFHLSLIKDTVIKIHYVLLHVTQERN